MVAAAAVVLAAGVVRGRRAQDKPAEDLTQDIAERHRAAGHE